MVGLQETSAGARTRQRRSSEAPNRVLEAEKNAAGRCFLSPQAAAPAVEIPNRIVNKASILSPLVLRPGGSRVNK